MAFHSFNVGVSSSDFMESTISYKREQIYSFWNPSQDRLLSTVVGDISGEGHYFKVLKFRTTQGVRMEF